MAAGGILLGVSLLSSIGDAIFPRKSYPATDNVQQGYVIPNKLEIKVGDKDKTDGKNIPETYLDYNENSYVFVLDEKGIPTVQPYEFIPAEIKPAKVIPSK